MQGLNTSSSVLLSGAERLKKSHDEKGGSHDKFHMELLRLRQNWRLKKVGVNIIGDLSYRSGKQVKG